MNNPIETQRLLWIDTLRGLAACAVTLFHFNEPVKSAFDPSFYKTFVGYGWLGVPAFFVISGFSIQSSAARTPSFARFASKRFWRIYPPYIASIVVVLIIVGLRKAATGTNDLITLPQSVTGVLATLTLTTAPVTEVTSINWVYWSLSYEVAFYILLGLTVLSSRLRWPFLIGLTLAACAIGEKPPRVLFFLDQWSVFALGAALALWRVSKVAFPLVLGGACLLDLCLNRPLAPSLTAVATVLLCAACLGRLGAVLNRERVVSRVGEWSYSLYLLHVPIGCWLLLGIFEPLRASSQAGRILGDLLMLLCCVVCSAAFFRWIELPSTRGWRALVPARRLASAPQQ